MTTNLFNLGNHGAVVVGAFDREAKQRTTETRTQTFSWQQLSQCTRKTGNHGIASQGATGIVDVFDAIETNQDQGNLVTWRAIFHRQAQTLKQQIPIR